MEVRIFENAGDFKYWIDGLNFVPDIVNMVVLKGELIVTFRGRKY